MKSAFFEDIGKVTIRELPDPELLASTDVIVQVEAAAICGSDLHIVAGHVVPETGFAIGHEYIGTIVAAGDAVGLFKLGDRVVGPAAPYCGSCTNCKLGQKQACLRGGILGSGPTLGDLGGAQSTLLRVPWADQNLVAIPEGVSDAAALSIGDILSTGWTGVRNAAPGLGETLVVIGCGPIGLSAIHTAKLSGAGRVIALDTAADRLEMAERMGADVTVVSGPDAVAEVRELTGGQGAAAIVDAAGVQPTMRMAGEMAAIGGRIALLGIAAHPLSVDFGSLLIRNVSLWTGLGDLTEMTTLMGQVAAGVLDPEPMFTDTCTLEEVPAMYQRLAAGAPETVKVMVTMAE